MIGADGSQIGVIATKEAQRIAVEQELDLVEVAPLASPPVCRLMDYGKFLFEENKKRQAAKKKQKQIQVKEVKFRPTTEDGDYQVKLRSLVKFLEGGDKAKVTIRFRGRELLHQELGQKMAHRLEIDLEAFGIIEQTAKMEGRQLTMVLAPKK